MSRSLLDQLAENTRRDEHGKIHAGELFGISPIVEVAGSTKAYFLFQSGSVPRTHVTVGCVATGECIVRVHTGYTVTDSGVLVPFGNYNLLSTNTAQATAYTGTTVSNEGSMTLDFLVPGGTGGNAIGGVGGDGREILYPPSTQRLISIENLGGAAIRAELYITLYEREP